MADVLVVTSKVKKAAKELGYRTSKDFIEKLSARVLDLIKDATTEATEAKRKTLQATDLRT